MVTRDVLKVFQIALAYGSCNFENFQNITRAHKSRNALAFMRFPILITLSNYKHDAYTFLFSSAQIGLLIGNKIREFCYSFDKTRIASHLAVITPRKVIKKH